MNYMLLVVEPRGQRDTRNEEEGRAVYAEMLRFSEGLAERGILRAVESLMSDDHGIRVQRRDGGSQLFDGPFAEAKEMVGGFFLIDCESREAAVAIAEQCPAARWATIEVRECAPCFVK